MATEEPGLDHFMAAAAPVAAMRKYPTYLCRELFHIKSGRLAVRLAQARRQRILGLRPMPQFLVEEERQLPALRLVPPEVEIASERSNMRVPLVLAVRALLAAAAVGRGALLLRLAQHRLVRVALLIQGALEQARAAAMQLEATVRNGKLLLLTGQGVAEAAHKRLLRLAMPVVLTGVVAAAVAKPVNLEAPVRAVLSSSSTHHL